MIKFKHRGDSILEVMVAMVLMSSILIAAFSLLDRAITTNVDVKNRIIALNVAREGMEAVRNIRDTNWLKYSGDRRSKWLCADTVGNKNACNGSNTDLINPSGTETYYIVDYELSDNRYYLREDTTLSADLDLTSSAQALDSQQYRLNLDTALNRYTHEDSVDYETSQFYRQIKLSRINPYDEIAVKPNFCDDEPDCFRARLQMVVSVHWLEDGRPKSVRLEGHLFDFFERDEYSDV